MNASNNEVEETFSVDLYDPKEQATPAALLWVALAHSYCVAVLGALGNALALWCVGTCKKTLQPVKVMLFSVFVPALVICLVTRPVVGEQLLSHLKHDPYRVSEIVGKINSVVYSILAQTELATIAAVAVIRAASVWAPQRPTLELQSTVLLLTAIWVYATLTGAGLVGLLVLGELNHQWAITLISAIYFLNTTLPALITAAAYILMIYVIQQNKRRMAARQQQPRAATAMDHATRAMLAVFISNLIFGLPHSIYHLMGRQPFYMHVIFHVIFSTHFVVDPLAFVWFNSGYRRHVFSSMRKVRRSISSSRTSSFLHGGSVSKSDHRQQPTTHKQNDNNV